MIDYMKVHNILIVVIGHSHCCKKNIIYRDEFILFMGQERMTNPFNTFLRFKLA